MDARSVNKAVAGVVAFMIGLAVFGCAASLVGLPKPLPNSSLLGERIIAVCGDALAYQRVYDDNPQTRAARGYVGFVVDGVSLAPVLVSIVDDAGESRFYVTESGRAVEYSREELLRKYPTPCDLPRSGDDRA